jgi:hypothetical protein
MPTKFDAKNSTAKQDSIQNTSMRKVAATIESGKDKRSEQINDARFCKDAEKILAQYSEVKKGTRDVDEWRSAYIAARRECKDHPPGDCDPSTNALVAMFAELELMNNESRGGGGGKMLGGALYDRLVAQLTALGAWLTGHATNISNCAKWFLQKIWSVATLAAQAIVRAGNQGAGVASSAATMASNAATNVANALPDVIWAAGEASGINGLLAVVELLFDMGNAALTDITDTMLGDQSTTTFGFAVRALACVFDPISPYAQAINADINRIMTDNMDYFRTSVEGTIPTPEQFTVILAGKSVPTKLYMLSVSLKFAQTLPFFTRTLFTAIIAANNTFRFFGPMCWSVFNSNIFTLALLTHASFYSLSQANQEKLLNAYNKLDLYAANQITIDRAKVLKTFNKDIEITLTGDELAHYTATVGLKQQIARVNADTAGIRKLLEYNAEEAALASQVAAAKENAERLEAELIRRRAAGAAAPSVFGTGAGAGAGAGFASLAATPSSLFLSSSSSSSRAPGAGAGAGAGSDAANGSLPRSEAEDMELGGNRSTRKRGSNKKGGAKSKRSPKSTRKGGRKHSARKRR